MNFYLWLPLKTIWRKLRDIIIRRRADILAHRTGLRRVVVESLIVPDLAPDRRDVEIAERLLAAYRRSVAVEAHHPKWVGSDIWSHIRNRQSVFLNLLDLEDAAALAAYLCNMSRHDATLGTVQGHLEYRRILRSRSYRRHIALMAKDKLVSLAEAVGAISCENPEQGQYGENLHLDLDYLVAEVERVVGLQIAPPPIDGGLLKIRCAKGLFNERDLNAIYTAWSLKQLLSPAAALAEIGAGSGRVAYWSWRFGFRSQTIFDLPHINVVQGYYLIKALPGAPIALFGETAVERPGQGIAILPYYRIQSDDAMRFDLVLNQDSFPEIHIEVVRSYLRRVKALSGRYFLSINHESRPRSVDGGQQLSVPQVVAEVGGYRRLWRMPYWLRRGYVFELYEICR